MIQISLAGASTLLLSSLCARCPHGAAGCCAAPPAVAWADIGRVVSLGGRDFLLEEIRAGRLRPGSQGLSIQRSPPSASGPPGEQGAASLPARCVYLGPRGCVLPPERRSATCNYYLCDEALADGGEADGDPAASAARGACARLTEVYGDWDLELAALVARRFHGGPPWDADFLDWIGVEWRRIHDTSRRTLRALESGTPRGAR